MKQFIYLDTDIVNSIIAQANKGLITELLSEQSETNSSTTQNSIESDLSGTIGGSFLKLAKAEAEITIGGSLGNEQLDLNSSREIATKILHDAAFDFAYNVIEGKIGKDIPEEIGAYIEISKVFDFVDLEYIDGLFSHGGLIDYFKKTSKEKIENEVQNQSAGLNRDQLRKSGVKIRSEINKIIGQSNKQFDDIQETLNVIRKVIPYKRMLVSNDGFLIPLEDKFFRIDFTTMGFKYGGELTCIGMTTNIIGEDTDPNDSANIFATLQYSINEILRALLPTREKNLWIIHPIALYYGK
ncbi:DUF6414 family protein [Acidaminobacter sp.]|uniref:DUF6414 family protein n=1 Tax=Acidaminobacter sp. TaxID=1872102 RepID=UPI0025C45A80|nr:hypothetical protein [Acidaminobacter sp.]